MEAFIGLLALTISIYVFFAQRTAHKKKNTLEYLHRLVIDDKLIDASNGFRYKMFYLYCHDDLFIMKWREVLDIDSLAEGEQKKYQKNTDSKRDINLLLNYFDALAIGIKVGIYDFQTAKLSRNQQIIRTFRYSAFHINAIRKTLNNPNLFIQLEQLAKKLESDE